VKEYPVETDVEGAVVVAVLLVLELGAFVPAVEDAVVGLELALLPDSGAVVPDAVIVLGAVVDFSPAANKSRVVFPPVDPEVFFVVGTGVVVSPEVEEDKEDPDFVVVGAVVVVRFVVSAVVCGVFVIVFPAVDPAALLSLVLDGTGVTIFAPVYIIFMSILCRTHTHKDSIFLILFLTCDPVESFVEFLSVVVGATVVVVVVVKSAFISNEHVMDALAVYANSAIQVTSIARLSIALHLLLVIFLLLAIALSVV